jgi:hypothetical protein
MAGLEEARGVQSARAVVEEARCLGAIGVHMASGSVVATGRSGSRRSAQPYCKRSRHARASKRRMARASERFELEQLLTLMCSSSLGCLQTESCQTRGARMRFATRLPDFPTCATTCRDQPRLSSRFPGRCCGVLAPDGYRCTLGIDRCLEFQCPHSSAKHVIFEANGASQLHNSTHGHVAQHKLIAWLPAARLCVPIVPIDS